MKNESRVPLSLLDEVLCTALAVGSVLVLLLPAARGMSVIGWLPMWLVGMPAVAWWALRGLVMPYRVAIASDVAGARTARRTAAQARRCRRPVQRPEARRAA